ncbi:hypothetical protein [Magnetospirillum sp. 64-120]|uniref:hypothetical protein n=1 Tax=Magnetospirillum sp. 64-120 TaxID=1895778 RepID=UPI0025C19FC7|nr:hypothetical protein [Magnetospirillum sp. 64-120]
MSGMESPSKAAGLYEQAKALLDAGKVSETLDLAEAHLAQGDEPDVALMALAAASYRHGLIGNVIQLIHEMMALGQDYPDSQELLAILYCQGGMLSKALYHSKEASITKPDGRMIALFGPELPNFADALARASHKPLMRAAQASLEAGDVGAALVQVEQHLMIAPEDVEAIDLYAAALMKDGQMDKALGMLRSLVTLGGQKPTLLSRIGKCLTAMGRHQQGLANHRLATSLAPAAISLWGDMVADLAYVPAGHSEAVALTEAWVKCVETNAVKSPRPAPQLPQGNKHLVAFLCTAPLSPLEQEMLAALLSNLDKARFATLGLGRGELSAEHNTIFRGLFDRWRNAADLDVLTLGALVRGEGVSILIDVDGLRSPARAGLFLRKSAPLQCSWLNTPAHGAVPAANMHLVSVERGLDGEVVVPGGRYLCDVVPFSAGALPSASGNGFAFGADVTLAEITPDTAALWAQVLGALPDTTLLLRDRGRLSEQENVTALIELFGNFGVAHRIDVVGAELEVFCSQVDVMLAPSPRFDVLQAGRCVLAGVPVLALSGSVSGDDLAAALNGSPVAGRMVAGDSAGYVENARQWCQDGTGLAAYRAAPKAALAGAVSFDRVAYVRAFGECLSQAISRKAAAE